MSRGSDPLSVFDAAREAPDAPALVVDDAVLSYRELAARVALVASRLDPSLGPDAWVALGATNRLETVLALYALLARGVPFVPLHPRLTAPERDALIADASPARVLLEPELCDLAAPSPSRAACVSATPPADPASLLAVLYTSGTTGRPRGALLTRGAFLASAAGSAANLGWQPDDRWVLTMPVCHVGGLSVLTRCLIARRCVVLLPRFEPGAVLAAITRHRGTLLSVVPTMLTALLDADRLGTLARLRAVLVGGAAASPSLLARAVAAGVPALATYGLTEACSQVTTQALARPLVAEPGCGRPLRGVELAVLDAAGAPAHAGEVGRIHLRGPTLMRGYLHAPPLEGRWFDTGDLGALDEAGRLHVYTRRTDLIVTGGENVYPLEVEQALALIPGVRDALVFGVPDETWGQLVAAALVPSTEAALPDDATLAALIAERLASHKRPRRVCTVAALPSLPSGKTDRAGAATRLAGALRALPRPG